MKLKFAAVAALAAALAAPAFAVTDLATMDDVSTAVSSNALALLEFAAVNSSASDGNFAVINQETSSNIAYIDQLGLTNFAVIGQTTSPGVDIAVIYQTGDNNRAAIYQHN
jgi:hypothetical protein